MGNLHGGTLKVDSIEVDNQWLLEARTSGGGGYIDQMCDNYTETRTPVWSLQ